MEWKKEESKNNGGSSKEISRHSDGFVTLIEVTDPPNGTRRPSRGMIFMKALTFRGGHFHPSLRVFASPGDGPLDNLFVPNSGRK